MEGVDQLRNLHHSGIVGGGDGSTWLVAAEPFACGAEDRTVNAFPGCQLHIILSTFSIRGLMSTHRSCP